jgi:TonB family protein
MAKFLVCLTVLLMASVFSVAQSTPQSDTITSLNFAASGNDLLRICDDSNSPTVVRGTCLGYVRGVIDGIRLVYGVANTAANSEKPVTTKTGESFCIPDSATADQKLHVVIQFIKAHPEKAAFPTDSLIWEAASEAFACSPAANRSGVEITGGGGDFGTKYAWYVQVIQRKVAETWLKSEGDPGITTAHRTYITFNIARDGHPSNVRVEQSCGVPFLDLSAVRAVQSVNTFGALPPDYAGNNISVEYWFDYKR